MSIALDPDKFDGGPAFPRPATVAHEGASPADMIDEGADGMTLRDWFAGKAMTGWLATFGDVERPHLEPLAKLSYEIADAMLAERAKRRRS